MMGMIFRTRPGAFLKNAFRQMYVTVCGRLNHLTDDLPNEGVVGRQRHKGQCLTSTECGANSTQSGEYDAMALYRWRE